MTGILTFLLCVSAVILLQIPEEHEKGYEEKEAIWPSVPFYLRDNSVVLPIQQMEAYRECHSTEIIGGKEVPKHSMPYMVLVHGKNNEIFCGGALIAPKWVITAAHCQNISMKVLLGVHARSKNDKEIQIRKVKNTVPHPCFHNTDKVHDIMLLKLDKEVKSNAAVSNLSLPNSGGDVPDGTNCIVAGWGLVKNKAKKGSDVLMAANVTVINRKKCNTEDYYNFDPIITKDMLCAGSVDKDPKDSCQGDSGGPLICGRVFRAITSFGKGCGLQKKPGVYTLLTQKHIEWIKKTIRRSD